MDGSEAAPGEAHPGRETPPAGDTRTGFSTDMHPFGPELGLWLGGVEIPAAPRLHGHSDGDAAIHAIAGALLGAGGLGDLALKYGWARFDYTVIWVVVITLVILVQAIQAIGNAIARKVMH